MLVDPPLVGHLGVGPEIGLFISLIPEVQPVSQKDSGLGLVRRRRSQRFPELRQLRGTLRLGFGQDIFGDRQALVIVAYHIAALPAAILSQVDAAVAAGSTFCHGDISSPK